MSFLDFLLDGADDVALNTYAAMMVDGLDSASTEEDATSFRRPLATIDAEIARRAEADEKPGGAS